MSMEARLLIPTDGETSFSELVDCVQDGRASDYGLFGFGEKLLCFRSMALLDGVPTTGKPPESILGVMR
jgi:hypothetical protein